MEGDLRFDENTSCVMLISYPRTPCHAWPWCTMSDQSSVFLHCSFVVPCETFGSAGLTSSGFSSFPSPAFCFAPSGVVMFGSKAASSFLAAVSSVPDFAYSFASVFIFSRSCWASLCGLRSPPSLERSPNARAVVKVLG